ncbi:MAG: pirin family protein [Planctomycetes bacterium]|nr:pirin family protein [Planctomycetota bacterium]
MIRIIPAKDRHSADHGWLKPTWLFSFADYHDEDNMQFGTLRVFNDDVIAAGTGFGMHGHRDMEIVTVVLEGAVTHQDSMGNKTVINAGEVQRMSAGTGVMHSEHNRGATPLHLYQVWFPPRKTGIKPDYEQRDYSAVPRANRLLPVVSGFGHAEAMAINSDAVMSLADLEPGKSITVPLADGRGLFIYVMGGTLTVNGKPLAVHDQARISGEKEVTITGITQAKIITVEVTGV